MLRSIASYLARQSVRVKLVFKKTDAILSAPFPIPTYVRNSRLMSVFSPYMALKTRLEYAVSV
jgi:dimethylaniline monooxygenase (N-oxide forming)